MQYKDTQSQLSWTDFPGTAVVNGTTGWQTDAEPAPTATRFYRVVVVVP